MSKEDAKNKAEGVQPQESDYADLASYDVGVVKKGDYLVHIFIQEARHLRMKGADTVDPIVQVNCFDKDKFTTAKNDISTNVSVQWSEHVFFEPKNLTEIDLQNAKINITVFDQQLFKNTMVGTYEMDVAYVYFQDKHWILNQWIGLSNPNSKTFNEVTGYLKVSISVIGPGDEQIPLTDDRGIDRTDKEVMLLPPHISVSFYQLKFRLIKAEWLPKMDYFGECDSFVEVNYLGKTIKTSTVTQSNEQVFWGQEIWLPIQAPLVSSRIVMSVFDHDSTSGDDIIGSMSFQIDTILNRERKTKKFPWMWKDIYGAPINVKGKNTDEMNRVPELGSQWKGRIFMQVWLKKSEKPEMKVESINENILNKAKDRIEYSTFEIKAEVFQGICLPKGKHKVKIKIGECELLTGKPKKAVNGFCFWNERFEEKVIEWPYESIATLPDVIVYIMDGNDPICYYRAKASEFADPNAEMKWVALINDKSVGEVKEAFKAGMLAFKLSIHDQTQNGDVDWDFVPAWTEHSPDNPDKYPVRCHIFQCKGLPPSDDNGTSDPYVKIWSPYKSEGDEEK